MHFNVILLVKLFVLTLYGIILKQYHETIDIF